MRELGNKARMKEAAEDKKDEEDEDDNSDDDGDHDDKEEDRSVQLKCPTHDANPDADDEDAAKV